MKPELSQITKTTKEGSPFVHFVCCFESAIRNPQSAFLLLALLLMVGCAIGPNYHRPAAAVPMQFNDSSDPASTNSLGHEQSPDVDHFVLNEAEVTLPEFLRDFDRHTARRMYASPDLPDIRQTPPLLSTASGCSS